MKAKSKILGPRQLKKWVETARKKGQKIVFTNGCFDILHAGHVSVLEFSRSKGDLLVVGLNSDASVRRLKGPTRPVNTQADRALVLAALESVSAVCIFNEDTPYNLIKLVRPDVLVKGGDYKPSEIVGREFAKKVVRFALLKGRSTTNIIKKVSK
ncbi:D-glycero-beta-D-manno-heptose 1-phosphate adenylyltransferase [Candidatus Avelusimicrobium caledoniensis]|uniref:D-glycero-beta-D-manno-heptose 1-phosphate adenylyltransferase n=1 Tax=Candidatus Avelusimicrobium caledoniensis TaxID=3416220 RepID=UPI003D0A2D5E